MKGLMEAKTALCREIPLYQSSLHKIFRSVKLSLLKESLHCEKISEINLVFSVSFESRVTTIRRCLFLFLPKLVLSDFQKSHLYEFF